MKFHEISRAEISQPDFRVAILTFGAVRVGRGPCRGGSVRGRGPQHGLDQTCPLSTPNLRFVRCETVWYCTGSVLYCTGTSTVSGDVTDRTERTGAH